MSLNMIRKLKEYFIRTTAIAGLIVFSFHEKAPAALSHRYHQTPRIVNIVNFIRLLEPRDPSITEDVLYQTVANQVDIMKKYHLRGTFLLQYDALVDSRYQRLLKSLPKDSYEIGAWWELPQPLIEKAGLKWRGRYPWDWRADVGFSTGYTPAEREKIIDVYMGDFKKTFGYYPRTVASWFIDAHSLKYMYDKYHIVASANCKDQYGTDGYTLWGGYWNQAYYPSKINSYMPAQHVENQIPVPIFRMLGSDPVRQYDTGVSSSRQGVITLEPVYPDAGGSDTWVKWFFKTFTEDPSLNFNYTQAGQENSFTWTAMKKGFEIQMPLIARLRDEGKIRLETMEESGRWFSKNYKVTPPTSFTVTKDVEVSDKKTIWFNSRFYRVNLLWEEGGLRIRDLHLFNEDLGDIYTTQTAKSNECSFFTLPVVDGYIWSKPGNLAGMRLKVASGGKEVMLKGGQPVFTNSRNAVHISWPLTEGQGKLKIDLNERTIKIHLAGHPGTIWYLDLDVAEGAKPPFTDIGAKQVKCEFDGMDYQINAVRGVFSKPSDGSVLWLKPEDNVILLDCAVN